MAIVTRAKGVTTAVTKILIAVVIRVTKNIITVIVEGDTAT